MNAPGTPPAARPTQGRRVGGRPTPTSASPGRRFAAPTPAGGRRSRRWAVHVLRTLLGGGLLALAVLAVAHPVSYRSLEAAIAVPFAGLVTPGEVLHNSGRDVFVVGAGTSRFWAFRLTPECTSAILIVPLLAIGGFLLMATRRFEVARILRAIGITAGIVLTVNLIRLASIAWASMTWDDAGYQASHTFVGSGFSFFGFCLALLLGARTLLTDRTGGSRS